MKHLKLYEELEDGYVGDYDVYVGDYIVLLYPDASDLAFGFKRGEMYTINYIYKLGQSPFQIKKDEIGTTSLSRYQFRLATEEEVSIHKYNL